MISGYVITSSLFGRPSKDFKDFISGFCVRRIKRLVPAHYVFVLIISITICLFNPSPGLFLKTGLTSLFGLSNLYLLKQSTDYFAQSTELNVFTHTWSLGVEEQFYILFPLLIWFSGFGRQTRNGTRNLLLAVGTLTIASLIGFLYLYPTNQTAAYFLMPSRFWEMAAGCLIFLGLQKRASIEQFQEKVSPLLVLALIVGVMYLPMSMAVTSTIAVVALSSITIASLKNQTLAFKIFTHPRIVYVGLISYSLYLWHWGVLSISRWTIGIHWWSVPFQVALMFGLAIASHIWIEIPLRKGNWFGKRWKILLVSGGALISLSGGLIALGKPLKGKFFLGRNPNKLEFIKNNGWDYTKCAIFFEFSVAIPSTTNSLPTDLTNTFDNCWISKKYKKLESPSKKQTTRVFAYGNSYTQQLVPSYIEIGDADQFIDFNVVTSNCGASTILQRSRASSSRAEACKKISSDYIKYFQKNSHVGDILIIAESFVGYSYDNTQSVNDLKTGRRLITSEEGIEIRSGELSQLSSEIAQDGKALIYASGIPYLYGSPMICGEWFQISNQTCNSLNFDSAKLQHEPYLSIISKSGDAVIGLDIFSELTSAAEVYEGKLYELYYKINHINRRDSSLLTPIIMKSIEASISY